jgi:hypothetical protein
MMEGPASHKVNNRAELRSLLENRLIAPEDEDNGNFLSEDGERRSLKPKTYLIESNGKLGDVATNGYQLMPSNDKSLWNLLVSDGRKPFFMYVDTLDPRFWIVHSTYYADESHAAVQSLVLNNHAKLDFTWFSSDALLDICRDKITTGFGINYTNAFAPKGEGSGLSARVWGRDIPSVLDGLRKISQIESQISVSSITLRNQVGVGFVNEDIFRYGKMTAKGGDSIDNHLNLIDTVKEYYKALIQDIERDYITRYSSTEHYCTLHGTYSVISFSHFVPNLKIFADVLTAGTDPFRIWGVWRAVTENHIRIHGIDQHTNTPVELELMPDEMRIILGEGACGNIVTRLFTNIQSRFDSNCSLKGLNDGYIIRPHPAS